MYKFTNNFNYIFVFFMIKSNIKKITFSSFFSLYFPTIKGMCQ